MKYEKKHISFDQQVELLKSRGILINDKDKVENFLSNVNYYKFSSYTKYFEKEKDNFENVDIEEIIYLYYFDRDLRNKILLYLEKIEISIKTKIAYVIAENYGAFGHLNNSTFFNKFNHNEFLQKITELEKNSKEFFIKKYFEKYDEEDHTPIWILIEIISFGTISKMYQFMQNKEKKEIAKFFNTSKVDFESWLKNITLLRNFCAHNSVIWNKRINSISRSSKKWKNIGVRWERMSGMIFLLNYLVKEINPNFNSRSLYDLLKGFSIKDKDRYKKMGFSDVEDLEFLL